MGFRAFGDCFQDATVRDVTVVSCDGPGIIVAITFAESIGDALEDSNTVEWSERLGPDGGDATYLYKIVAPTRPKGTPSSQEQGLGLQTVTAEDRGVTLVLVVARRRSSRKSIPTRLSMPPSCYDD